MKTDEEVRKEYTHAQSNVNIMTEVCKRLSDTNSQRPTDRLAWWKGYVAALAWWLK